MNLEFSNKRVLIPGSSKGIGRACARTFLAEAARAALVSRLVANLLAAQSTLLNDASGATINIIGLGGNVATATRLKGGAASTALMLASAGLARAYAGKGVRVNAVKPGSTFTERRQEGMQAEARQHGISIEEALTRSKATNPLGRAAEPSAIADAVVCLA